MSKDDLRDFITEKMEDGIELTAEDFEGHECSYCGEIIGFHEAVRWDIQLHEHPPGWVARHYFCSSRCKRNAQRDERWGKGEIDYGEHVELSPEDKERIDAQR